ncbi:EAL domain-containing protein [Massilia terrae]|uniref:EAL domain-containing protein n=1 Tax=Massilia terrae TaxID=1811224 RepID=A0ABT2CYN9_9BURK|nr:EAL domain-containing protein [Massilia terrae]MCS0659087.1 EAL domain-containing protein [Massilia terrae]
MEAAPLPIAVFVVDAAGNIESWNKACEKMAGYTASDIRGSRLDRIISFDESGNCKAPSLPLTGECEATGHLTSNDGRRIPVRVTIAPQALDPDKPDSFSVIVAPRPGVMPPRYALIQDLPVTDIIEGLPCVFYVIDQSGHLLLWNRQLEAVLERTSEELPTINVQNFFDEKDALRSTENILDAFEHGSSSHEAELIGKFGKRTACLFNCARTSLGNVPCVFGTGLDISARKEAELSLLLRERAISCSVNAILISCCKNKEFPIEYVNPAFEQITGYTLDEIKGRDPRFMRVEGCDEQEHERIRDALQRHESVHAIVRNARKNGEIFWNDLRIDPVVNQEGEVTHFVGVINDITEAKHYERRLQHLAHHDPLTGLANRTLLHDRLGSAIEQAVHEHTLGALAFLDLDNFKYINDTFGHDAGDEVLREIAQRLRAGVRDEDTVARVGGDEFVLVINDQPSPAHVAELVERLRHSVSAPVTAEGNAILPGVSIGVSLFPRDGERAERVMRAADAAMYHAKTMGKNNCQFYSPELNQAVHDQLLLEASLSRAIRDDDMVVGYQPKVDLRSGKIVGAEALVRWRHPDKGIIPPDRFIPVAEATGLIVPLGELVLSKVCATLKEMRSDGAPDFVISVNLSARQLRQRQFVTRLGQMLAQHQVEPGSLELEVTESQLMDQPEEAVDVLEQLKGLGVRLSIDDFGTGYSSLSYLRKFPVDFIKIDRSFLSDVSIEGNGVITRAIIGLGHSLRMKVVAEGVETREQIAFLRDYDCDQMQGYYFSPPVPRDSLRQMVSKDTRLPD